MKLSVDIVTPRRHVLSSPCDEVTLPGADGEIGVLPEHAALVSTLTTGAVALREGGATKKLAIRGGFLQILANRVTLLADEATKKEEIDATKLAQEKAQLEAKLQDPSLSLEQRSEILKDLEWVDVRQTI